MYVDDLILVSPSVTVLQELFKIDEEDALEIMHLMHALEMSINPRLNRHASNSVLDMRLCVETISQLTMEV